jgi:hypothetical protein
MRLLAGRISSGASLNADGRTPWRCGQARHGPGLQQLLQASFATVTSFKIKLPMEVADDLVTANVAARPRTTRGASLVDIVQVLVDGINVGASVVTVAVAASSLRKAGRRLTQWLRSRRPDQLVRLKIESSAGEHTLDLDLSRSEEDVVEEVVALLQHITRQ